MNVVFNREDFILCKVPVPIGYPQSQTHCGIVRYNGNYYLTTSPYPNPLRPKWMIYLAATIKKLSFKKINILYKGENYENPMLYIAVDYTAEDIPVGFKLLEGSPLMEKPKDPYGYGSFCSDPDLSVIDGKLHILNRTTVRGNIKKGGEGGKTTVYLIKGTEENGKFVKTEQKQIFVEGYKSPCLTVYHDKYYYFALDTNTYNDGGACKSLLVRESTDLTNWNNLNTVMLKKGEYEPWHISVFSYNNKLYAIIACIKRGESHRCWQMLGEFCDDLTELVIYQKPLTDYKSYRGAAMVREDGEFILYNTTVREKIKGGKAVDGREVIVAHKQFEELLNELREEEK